MELGALEPVLVHLRRLAVLVLVFFALFIFTSFLNQAIGIASLHRLLGFALRSLLLLFGFLRSLQFLLHFRLGLVELLRRLLHCTVEPGAFDLVARLWFILLRFVKEDGIELGRSVLVLHFSSEFLLLWTQLLHRTVDG